MSTAHFQHFTPESLDETLSSHFAVDIVIGQEHRTLPLFVIERVLENRFWLFGSFAERFNNGPFMRYWNEATARQGQNLVARYKKK